MNKLCECPKCKSICKSFADFERFPDQSDSGFFKDIFIVVFCILAVVGIEILVFPVFLEKTKYIYIMKEISLYFCIFLFSYVCIRYIILKIEKYRQEKKLPKLKARWKEIYLCSNCDIIFERKGNYKNSDHKGYMLMMKN